MFEKLLAQHDRHNIPSQALLSPQVVTLPPAAEAPLVRGAGESILFVDDEESLRAMLERDPAKLAGVSSANGVRGNTAALLTSASRPPPSRRPCR
mgnify:CR=1 FL=1